VSIPRSARPSPLLLAKLAAVIERLDVDAVIATARTPGVVEARPPLATVTLRRRKDAGSGLADGRAELLLDF
jgi:hypothetical protein